MQVIEGLVYPSGIDLPDLKFLRLRRQARGSIRGVNGLVRQGGVRCRTAEGAGAIKASRGENSRFRR